MRGQDPPNIFPRTAPAGWSSIKRSTRLFLNVSCMNLKPKFVAVAVFDFRRNRAFNGINYSRCVCAVAAGLLLPSEQFVIENMKSSENIYFVPFVWATTIVERARKEGRIKGEILVQSVLNASIGVTYEHDFTSL